MQHSIDEGRLLLSYADVENVRSCIAFREQEGVPREILFVSEQNREFGIRGVCLDREDVVRANVWPIDAFRVSSLQSGRLLALVDDERRGYLRIITQLDGTSRFLTPKGIVAHMPWKAVGNYCFAYSRSSANKRGFDVHFVSGNDLQDTILFADDQVNRVSAISPCGRWVAFQRVLSNSLALPILIDRQRGIAIKIYPDGWQRTAQITDFCSLKNCCLVLSEASDSTELFLLDLNSLAPSAAYTNGSLIESASFDAAGNIYLIQSSQGYVSHAIISGALEPVWTQPLDGWLAAIARRRDRKEFALLLRNAIEVARIVCVETAL